MIFFTNVLSLCKDRLKVMSIQVKIVFIYPATQPQKDLAHYSMKQTDGNYEKIEFAKVVILCKDRSIVM